MNEYITIPVKDIEDKIKQLELDYLDASMRQGVGLLVVIGTLKELLKLYLKPNDPTEPEIKQIGTLNKRWGLNGYEVAEVGHPVYEKGDRYVLYISHPTLKPLEVPFNKKTLNPVINKF